MAKSLLPVDKVKLLAALPDITFVNDEDVDQYRCEWCGDVALHHYVATCGHTFCRKCYGKFANKACPGRNCSNASINKVSQMDEFEQGVYNLQVHCMFKTNGCNEILILSDILDHKSRCKFSTLNLLPKLWSPSAKESTKDEWVKEFNELKAVVETLQQQKHTCNCQSLENSIRREIHEQYSILERQIQALEKKLLKEMNDQKLTTEVNLKSSLTVECEKIKSEFKKRSENLEKKLETVQTENFKTVGELGRNYNLICSKVDAIKVEYDDLDSSVSRGMETLDRNVALLSHQFIEENSPEFSWTIRGIEAKLNDLITGKLEMINSRVLHAKDYGVKIEANLWYYSQLKTLGLQYQVVDWNKSLLPKIYEFHQARLFLLDKSALNGKNVWRVLDFDCFGSFNLTMGMEYNNVVPIKFLRKGSSYIADDSIDIKVRLVPYSVLHKFFQSDNGILFWKLHNYTQLKQDGIDGVSNDIQSEEFYTTKRGYRIQMLIFFKETCMSICELCLQGEHDTFLSYDFPHTTEIVMFDQSDVKENQNVTKIVESEFARKNELFRFNYEEFESPRYLKNDCLLIKITVQHKPFTANIKYVV